MGGNRFAWLPEGLGVAFSSLDPWVDELQWARGIGMDASIVHETNLGQVTDLWFIGNNNT